MKQETKLKSELTKCLNMQKKIKDGTLILNPELKKGLHKKIIQLKTILYEDYGVKQ
jgi:hypothetical protein